MRKNLIVIALALLLANVAILGSALDSEAGHIKRPVHCTYAVESEMRVCQ